MVYYRGKNITVKHEFTIQRKWWMRQYNILNDTVCEYRLLYLNRIDFKSAIQTVEIHEDQYNNPYSHIVLINLLVFILNHHCVYNWSMIWWINYCSTVFQHVRRHSIVTLSIVCLYDVMILIISRIPFYQKCGTTF